MDTVVTAPPAACASLETALRERFGHDRFRPGQREIVSAVLGGRDTLAVLPTGGGKSLTFQLPAVVTGRTTLVVSPLLALMRDQVAQARGRGVAAECVDSTLDPCERAAAIARVRAGATELLYVAPEGARRLLAELAGSRVIGLLAVDEAHCVSQWGHDYRPDYRTLGEVRERLGPDVPVLAVTATATRRVADDIVASVGLRDPFVFRGTFFRPNLRLSARRRDGLRDARGDVLTLLGAHPHASAIVYRLARAGATSLAGWLCRHGVPASAYHAGLTADERARVQDAFLSGAVRVIVATVAFGMGVDKPDVRLVVHAELPDSLEAYAQEVGRAGRDGDPSDCVLLYAWSDVRRRDALAASSSCERRAAARVAVREVYRFATSGGCRHRALCAHFDEAVRVPCGSCDACGAPSPLRPARRC